MGILSALKATKRAAKSAPRAKNSADRLKGRPKKGAIKENISGAIKQVRAKKSVKAATGVKNKGKPVTNSRKTTPAQRNKALTARVKSGNKAAAAKTARGGTKLSSPSTRARTSTDSLRRKRR